MTTYCYAVDDPSELWGATRRTTNEFIRRHGFPDSTLPKGGKRRQAFIEETVEGIPLRAALAGLQP